MGYFSNIHAETASERAESSERHADYLSDIVRALTDGIPAEHDAKWWEAESNANATDYDVPTRE
jgi:hypothetical protein